MSSPLLFSIITVCLNPGPDLALTVSSVLTQDYPDFQFIIKDGLSQDGAQENHYIDPRVVFISQTDTGIYDAMNQALALCIGKYIIFMNAGDRFTDSCVLSKLASFLQEEQYPELAYVDRYNEKLNVVTKYPSRLSSWFLFRKPVCHQAQIVSQQLLTSRGGFDTSYQILADYEALLKFILVDQVRYAHCAIVGANYQDGGLSASTKYRQIKRRELYALRRTYFSVGQRLVYGLATVVTLPGLRVRLIHQAKVPWLRRMMLLITRLGEKLQR